MGAAPGDADDPVAALLDRDEAYDEDPSGPPPIRTHVYRAAVRAAINVRPTAPSDPAGAGGTEGERRAYHRGQLAALDAVRRAVADAFGVSTAGGSPPPTIAADPS